MKGEFHLTPCLHFSPNIHLLCAFSTLLKSDQWLRESHRVQYGVRGAINFRQVPDTNIYALGQPTMEAIDEVVHRVREAHPDAPKVVWITLREEPIVYINGAPYCLRREGFSLRNMKGSTLAIRTCDFLLTVCGYRLWWYFCSAARGFGRATER